MWEIFGSAVDVVHALFMAVWALGLPLLFVRRWPQLSRAYAVFAIAFIVLSQASEWLLDECFLTTIAGRLWGRSANPVDPSEWFTVRLAKWIFDRAPSRRSIVIASEALIFATAVGVLVALRRSASIAPRSASRKSCAEGAEPASASLPSSPRASAP